MTAIQLIGSLLAVPVGIASGYSFYLANFSPEKTCQNLRSGIVAMLDKSVDAATRRMLVRRDVETFEKTCGAVDPDATAAFKALLAADKPASPAAAVSAPAEPVTSRTDARAKEAARKVEPRQQAVTKMPAATETVRRDPVFSDTQWLDAVRQALVTRKPDAVEAAKPQTAMPTVRPARQEATLPVPAPAVSAPTPIAPAAAPALPPPVTVAPPPAQRADVDHPVPPGSIPESTPQFDVGRPEVESRSRLSKWISAIPLLGPVVDNARH